MSYYRARTIITALGTLSLWAVAIPAEAKTISLTYDIKLEFIGDHVRELYVPSEDDPDVYDETCRFGQPCYPSDWRPSGHYINIDAGDPVNLGLSIDLTPSSSPSSSGDFEVDIISCSSDYDGCRIFGASSFFYQFVSDFDATTGKTRLGRATGSGSFGETIDLFSSTLLYESEFGVIVPESGTCEYSLPAPEGFCGYRDYEANFNVTSFSVEGLEEIQPIPVPPALPLLASALFGMAAIRRVKARLKA